MPENKSIVVLFDGTWNGLDDPNPTNVRIMKDCLDPEKHEILYFEGPGNDEDDIIQHFLGGLFGIDCRSIRDNALEKVAEIFEPGVSISVFGFSRGAAIARMFCYELSKLDVNVDFLGCFDTVFAGTPFGPHQQEPIFGNLHVSPMVKVARHALSEDEDRSPSFDPNLMNKRLGVEEVWFKGNHADIGGGYADRGLADITLRWMAQEAALYGGLYFTGLPEHQTPKEPHYEEGLFSREARRIGVKVDGEWSTLEATRYKYPDIIGS